MPGSSFSLLKSRRLWPLCLTQACGALNDNLIKNALIVLVLFQTGTGGVGLSALAGALFIAPYILLSATAGQIADRFDKARVIRVAKGAEIALMGVAAAGFLTGSIPILLGVLFGLGVQAAVFGPLKYAILPDHLDESEIVGGNGVVEASTFLAILAGTVAGGALILLDNGAAIVSGVGLTTALVGLAASFRIPAAPPAAPSARVGWNIFKETANTVRQAKTGLGVWRSILGLSWFWVVGATLLTEFPSLAKDTLGSDAHTVTLFLIVFAVGVGLGSIGCARMLKGEISPRHVPFAALGISLFCWDFGRTALAAGPHFASAVALLSSTNGLRMLADLLLLAACGGIFSVPLYAILQEWSAPGHRARTIAANNIVNAVFMVLGAAVAGGFAALHVEPGRVLEITALANLCVAVWIVRILPQEVFRALFRAYFEFFHGVDVKGLENYRAAGDRVVIVSNHLSFADAALIACYLPDSPTFAVHTATAAKWWARPFLAAVDIFRVDVQSPYSIKRMIEAVRVHGRKLMIFPEGRLTKTGSLMKVYEGAGVVADKAGAKVVPISIDGLQFTRLGRMKGKLPMRWFPRLSVTIMPPVDITPRGADDMLPRQRREAAGRRLQDLLVHTVFEAKNTDKTLFSALLDARDAHGDKTPIAEDINRQPLSYGKLILGTAVLGRKLACGSTPGDRIGLLLPNANGVVVAFMALQAFGRVPAMLNFSAGADGMLSACKTANVTTVISSRAFVAKAKGMDKAIERMEQHVRFVWLEDVRASLGVLAKIRGKLDAMFPRRLPGARLDPNCPAVVLFTSGSEGTPKGVVHSHRSLLSNCAQLSSVIDFNGSDRVFNAMPLFHSFGMTGGMLLPLLHGVRTFYYPSPLHYRIVPTLIYDTDSTICFGTDTFLNGWARYAHPYDLYSMRYIFAGAEKVQEKTKRLYADRFGVQILEGYGATETAPALAMNTAMHSRPGTVGRFLPGIDYRLEPVPGIADGGRLFVRGPNVMLGYMRASAPGVVEALEDGWYDTGDIVSVDDVGYVEIKARAKRFAKIAGEMVSMTAAESLVSAIWQTDQNAVVNIPDPRKGEALLLVTTRKEAEVREILAYARERGVPEIMVPRSVLTVPSMPLLGTGKIDYPAVQKLVVEAALTTAPADSEELAAD